MEYPHLSLDKRARAKTRLVDDILKSVFTLKERETNVILREIIEDVLTTPLFLDKRRSLRWEATNSSIQHCIEIPKDGVLQRRPSPRYCDALSL